MSIPQPDSVAHGRWPDRIALAVLALVAALASVTFRDYGLGWDDFTHAQYGDHLLAYYATGFRDKSALGFVNLYMYGGGFDMAAALLAKILPFGLFETRRLCGAIAGLIGLAATWRTARHAGGPVAGLVALMLLAACPLYYGHMFINAKDAPFAVAMAIVLLGLVRAFEQYPRPAPLTVLILGLGFGLAIGSRIMAGFGAIAAILALLPLVISEAASGPVRIAAARLGTFVLALLPALVVAYPVMAVIWPWAVVDPLNPFRAIGYFAHFFEKPWHELFRGELLTPLEMPRSYLPVLFGVKLPEIFLLMGGAGTIGALAAAFHPAMAAQRRAICLVIALSALLPILVTVIAQPALYNGLRHFLFVLPPLAIAGGLAGAFVASWLRRYGRAPVVGATAVLLVGIELAVLEMVWLHPYQYTHFNHIAGGVRAAQSRYMLDYWGLAFKQAGDDLRQAVQNKSPPDGRKWRVAVCGPHPPAAVALGERFEPTWDPKGADFALSLGAFYCARLDAPVIVTVTRNGVVYATGYDLRGREVENLFTVPPVTRN